MGDGEGDRLMSRQTRREGRRRREMDRGDDGGDAGPAEARPNSRVVDKDGKQRDERRGLESKMGVAVEGEDRD